ncbi:MAG: pro-sigmaK processing inhibitor BofA family protein [Firmicutes bacterium]|nr:pro-sigmaK processing inhibitor BofA family protein [Bacillota bacterium]
MLASIPWRLIVWSIAGLVALYFLGWEAFGPPRKARVLLMNGISGLAASWGMQLIAGFFGAQMNINLAVLGASVLLGIPGAVLMGILKWVLR